MSYYYSKIWWFIAIKDEFLRDFWWFGSFVVLVNNWMALINEAGLLTFEL